MPRTQIDAVIRELVELRAEMIAAQAGASDLLDVVHPNYGTSARNLIHYLVLRRRDLRPLQLRLAALGLSSLGRAEPHVLQTVDSVLDVLRRLRGQHVRLTPRASAAGFTRGHRLLCEHTAALLGPPPEGRAVRIMVTMPSEAAREYTLVHDLVNQGMDCMRINCAHDDAAAWGAMIAHLRRAEQTLGRQCRVAMDLAGPKLRTGPLEPGPKVIRVHPKRDVYGRVTEPARVWITAEENPHEPPRLADACLALRSSWVHELRGGSVVSFTDARDSKRDLTIADIGEQGSWAEADQTSYLVPGTVFHHHGHHHGPAQDRAAALGEVPARENAIELKRGDTLIVTRDRTPGRAVAIGSDGSVLSPARIGCTLPEVFDSVRAGEAIWFDDGAIGGVVEAVEADHARVRITHLQNGSAKLRADKGINLPESNLALDAMTPKDAEDLAFVAKHADIVQLSFTNTARDVERLHEELKKAGGGRLPATVFKIETRRGFQNLPEILLAAMRWPSCGVMIARGDLAVECGFERLAEVQEEILWICEAAHTPAIWATQVLENVAKLGAPSRAEITDAAMADRAECVMLNKGPHVVRAVEVLDDILRRMQEHQAKKRAMLRHLRLADGLALACKPRKRARGVAARA